MFDIIRIIFYWLTHNIESFFQPYLSLGIISYAIAIGTPILTHFLIHGIPHFRRSKI